jgi:branched-chain amino acid transport system ATP-binding protein
MPLLEIANVEASYGAVQALRGITLKVEAGAIVALLGANGAGKTSVLKTISGIVDPLRGSVRFDGKDITGMEPDRIVGLGMSHVPEGREIFRLRTVHENLILGAYRRNDSAAIASDIERMYSYFTILREPRLILLDEPSLGLAPLLVKEIFSIIRRLREEGITILLVEQNANMALDVADYGYIMEVGRVVLEDSAEALLNNPTVKEFYLGISQDGAEAQGTQRWKRKKQWR